LPVSRPRAWAAVGIFTLLYLFSQIDRQVINIAVVPIKQSLALGDFRMSLILGPAFAICYAVAPFPLAWLADRGSRRLIVFWCTSLWAVATCATGLATSFEQMFAARMLTGIGEAGLMPCAYVIISRLFPPQKLAFALSVFSLGSVGGIALGFGLGGWLLGLARADLDWPVVGLLAPWRSLFLLTGLPCFALAFLLYFIPDRAPPVAAQAEGPAAARFIPFLMVQWKATLAILLGFGLSAFCTGALLAWLPAYTQMRFGWGPAISGPVMGAMVILVATIGKLGSGIFVDRLFRSGQIDAHPRFLGVMFLISAPFAIGAFFVDSGALFVAMIGIWFLLGFPIGGYGAALIQLMTPDRFRGQASAGFTFSLSVVGAGFGPAAVGALSQYLFVDPRLLGMALATTLALAVPLALLALWLGLPQIRLLIEYNIVRQ
jgi:MFS family permease